MILFDSGYLAAFDLHKSELNAPLSVMALRVVEPFFPLENMNKRNDWHDQHIVH